MLSSTASYNMMMTMIKPILVAVLALVAQVQGAAVGDKMAVEGYVMDQYCLDLGVLMDNPTVRSLEGPDVHCTRQQDEFACRDTCDTHSHACSDSIL